MSDDEYFDNDEIFNSAELDAILSLDEPVAPNVPVPPAPPRDVTPAPQPSGSNRPPQTPGARSSSNRFSTIMNALKKAPPPQSQAGPSNLRKPSGTSLAKTSFPLGPSTGLLDGSSKVSAQASRRKREDSSSGSESRSGTKSSLKRTRRESSSGSKQPHSSPNKAALKEVAKSSKAEGEIQGGAKVWAMIEDELQCAICCDLFVVPQITPCGHTACALCLKQWLSSKSNCPMCRTRILPSQKPADNLVCANIIDRMLKEHPEWQPGQSKRVEWNKRKQEWDKEVAQSNSRPRRYVPARTPTPAAQGPQRPLFNPDPDDDDESNSDSDAGAGFGSDFDEEDDNFQRELLNEIYAPVAIATLYKPLALLELTPALDLAHHSRGWISMATPADDHSEKLLVFHEWINVVGPLTTANVLDYFAACQLFWDPECNNNILRMQSQHLGTSVNLDELKTMRGIEYAVVHAEPPTLFIIHKRERLSPAEVRSLEAYYVYKNTIHKAFDLYSLVSNRLLTAVNCLSDSLDLIRPYKPEFSPRTGYQWNIIDDSPEDGDESAASTSRNRNQPKRQVTNVPGILAALQTTRAHTEQQQLQQQQRLQQEAMISAPGTGPGTRLMSLAPATPAPEAAPRAAESDPTAGAGTAKTPAPKGQGKKKQKRLSMVAERAT